MSGLETAISGGENVRATPCPPEDIGTLPEKVEFLMKMVEFLHKDVDQELRFARENCSKRPREALQALRKTKWCRKQLDHIDYAVKAMRELVDTLNEMIILGPDMSEMCASASLGVEFNEAELRAELELLKQNKDPFSMCLFELDKVEQRVPCPEMSPIASPSPPDKTEEEEEEMIEEQLEYLRLWASGCS